MTIRIGDIEYQVDDAIANKMLLDQHTIEKARHHYRELRDQGKEMRDLQKNYFRTMDSRILNKAKAAEALFDDLLINKQAPKAQQAELFTIKS